MKAPQRGFNLISLMVGVSLSMISILALLSLYKNLIGVSVQSIQDSRQDGQIAAAVLTAQRELLNAGFRVDASPVQIILLNDASLSNGTLSGTPRALDTATSTTPATGNAMIWTYKPTATGTAVCAGLLMKKDTGKETGTLLRLQGATNCALVSQWSTTTWTTTPLIEANQPAAFFSVFYSPCWPFGKTADATINRLQVMMTASTSTVDINSSEPQPAYVKSKTTTCLPNFEKSGTS
jgi:Tfp pilus assembly protein PilW